MSFRGRGGGRGGGGFRGGGRGGGGFRGGRGGGRPQQDFGPPETVTEVGAFLHPCQDQLVVKCTIEKVPYFNAPIFLENKEQVGKVDEIFGSIRDHGISVTLSENMKASSFKEGQKLFIDPYKLLPLERFTQPQARGGGRGRGGDRGRGGRGGFDRGRGGGFRGRGGFGDRGGRGGGFRGGDRGGFRGGDRGGFRGPSPPPNPRRAERGDGVGRGGDRGGGFRGGRGGDRGGGRGGFDRGGRGGGFSRGGGSGFSSPAGNPAKKMKFE